MENKFYYSNFYAEGYSVHQTIDNGYIISGYKTIILSEDRKILSVIKTNELGTILWDTIGGVSSFRYGYQVQETIEGDFIVIGETQSFGSLGKNIFAQKTNSSGDTLLLEHLGEQVMILVVRLN